MRGPFLTLRVARSVGTLAILLALIVPSASAAENPAQSPPAPGAAAAAKKDGSQTVQRQKQLAEEKELLRLFADTLEQVKLKYVDAGVSDRQLIEAAIRGMISELDPYSNYIPPEDLEQFRRGVEREYAGIGIHVAERDGHLCIISPMFGTPAWRAGLRAGDRILKIDDKSTEGLPIDDAVRLMTGDVGSDVTISVVHADEQKLESVTLKREVIRIPTVLGYRRVADGQWDYYCRPEQKIAYIRITAFSRNTPSEITAALQQLLSSGMQMLVLDLRFNPGGTLPEAIEVCDLFLHEGTIVSTEGRSEPKKTWQAREEGTVIPAGFPVVVLVNRFSASAAEIVSACLQDQGLAVVIGERTWGKASVQNVILLENQKSALRLTTASYQRPSGKNIHRLPKASENDDWGVRPNDGFAVECSRAELGRLVQHLSELEQAPPPAGAEKPADGEDKGEASQPAFIDRQLEKAIEYLLGRTGQPAQGADAAPTEQVPQGAVPNPDQPPAPEKK